MCSSLMSTACRADCLPVRAMQFLVLSSVACIDRELLRPCARCRLARSSRNKIAKAPKCRTRRGSHSIPHDSHDVEVAVPAGYVFGVAVLS